MRGQIWNCKNIEWLGTINDSAQNCLVVFLCFESHDVQKDVFEAIRRIEQINSKRYKKETLVIFPFAHFSSKLLPINKAKEFMEIFYNEAIKKFKTVKLLPFNEDKEVKIHLAPKKEDVSYFEY